MELDGGTADIERVPDVVLLPASVSVCETSGCADWIEYPVYAEVHGAVQGFTSEREIPNDWSDGYQHDYKFGRDASFVDVFRYEMGVPVKNVIKGRYEW